MRSEGLRVRLSRVPGRTTPGLLREPFRFQCPPLEEFSIDAAFAHQEYETITKGQFSRPSGRALRTFEVSTLLVDDPALPYGVQDGPVGPDGVKQLRKLLYSGTPVRFIATHRWGSTPEADMPVTLRSVRVTERMGEPDARYVTIGFVEWRDAKLRRDGKPKRQGSRTWPRTILLKKDGTWVYSTPHGVISHLTSHKLTLAWIARYVYSNEVSAAEAGRLMMRPRIEKWGSKELLAKHSKLKGRTTKITLADPAVAAKSGKRTKKKSKKKKKK